MEGSSEVPCFQDKQMRYEMGSSDVFGRGAVKPCSLKSVRPWGLPWMFHSV